jgi:hypothetical protein
MRCAHGVFPCRCAGIVKDTFQSLAMRTRIQRDQKIRDCFAAFILHNLKLESDAAYVQELRAFTAPEVECVDTFVDADEAATRKGNAFRTALVEQMWRARVERKAAAQK